MSLTTVAANVVPDESLARLPPSKPERFQRSDFIAAAIVFFVTFGVYFATLAPNVTLEDSGELITAAAKFGVGHPPGYPLWTMSGFLLTHVLPWGNLAWKMNLLDAIIGAFSNAVLTLLVCHSGRWLLQRWTEPEHQAAIRPYVFYAGLLAGLVIGFSDVMWSQAVISAVHGTLNALFINSVLLLFYLWMIEPQKTHRLVWTVFVFALGLTNHHTLVQIIPAFLVGALLLQATPSILGKPAQAPGGIFFSVFLAVNLFSLSILAYISWLSGFGSDKQGSIQLQMISQAMAWIILVMTAGVSFFYLREFRLKLFLLGALTVFAIAAYGYYLLKPSEAAGLRYTAASAPHFWLIGSFQNPGWLQGVKASTDALHAITTLPQDKLKLYMETRPVQVPYLLGMLGMAAIAVGLLFTSTLNRRLVIGVFVVGWIGLVPYSYEPFASSTYPPMNWGVPKLPGGFYYSVSREQFPQSLPTLIKSTFGKAIGVVPKDAQLDVTIGQPNYWGRLGKMFYYYGDNLQLNFTVPLIFLTLAVLFYLRRCDWPQINWFLFLGAAFFCVGFMLQIIAPQTGFDFERNLQYKVFHLQSHCIFVLMMAYGALALMTYLHELMPEVPAKAGVIGFGTPALFLALLPLWSNFDGCSQAGHWFGYYYGSDMMRDMDRNAVYFGGSDPGRFVPTYMAFVESQQPDRWKADWRVHPKETAERGSGFDRRDVTVITQNALCDSYYAAYIREQYDARFRPTTWTPFEKWLGRDQAYPKLPVQCVSNEELVGCWEEYQQLPEVAARVQRGEPVIRSGTNDVFDINGIVARKIFDANKKNHTFYLEQSVPITWMYPYLLPSGLIFKLNPEPLDKLPDSVVAEDRKFWAAYSQKLLSDPRYRIDSDAILSFGKLAYWHSDLYGWRKMDKEQEEWLRLALKLCPMLQDAVSGLVHLLVDQQRFDEALAVIQQAQVDDPRNDAYPPIENFVIQARVSGQKENELKAQLAKNPYDVDLNLELARLYQYEAKFPQLNDTLRTVAGLTNWTDESMKPIIQYYVDDVHNPDAAMAFLEARVRIDATDAKTVFELAALHAIMNQNDDALKYLGQAIALDPTNVPMAAKIDPRFDALHDLPGFDALVNPPAPATNAAPTNAPPVKHAKLTLAKPVKK
jgi:tetratricopeptide (TPR) repeat protein